MNNIKLLRTPSPFKFENLAGYWFRLQEQNGYDKPTWMLELLKKRWERYSSLKSSDLYFRPHVLLSGITTITGIPVETLKSLIDKPGKSGSTKYPTEYKILNQWIPNRMLKLSKMKICPQCLAEKAFINRLWNLIPLTACPEHKCILVDRCPKCNKEIDWNRSKISECSCKYDLRLTSPPITQSSSLLLSSHIYYYCGFPSRENGVNDVKAKTTVFGSLNMEQMLTLVVFTAAHFRNPLTTTKFELVKYTNSEMHSLLAKGYEVFQKWPSNYYEFLDQLRMQQRDVKEYTGFRRDFGKYHFYLYQNFAGSQYRFLREAFEDYLADWDGGHLRSYALTKNANSKAKYLAARDAAKMLEIKHQRIPELVRKGLLQGKIRQMGIKTLCLVEKRSVVELKTRYKNSLNLTETARLLGTGTDNVIAIVKNKNLEALHGSATEGGGKWKISQSAIRDFIDNLDRKVNPHGSVKIKSIKLLTMQQSSFRLRISIPYLVKAVLNGDIVPSHKTAGQQLRCYLFSEDEIAKYKKEFVFTNEDQLSIFDVRSFLRIQKLSHVYFLIKRGLLIASKHKFGRVWSLRVSVQEAKRFAESYVRAVEIAKKMNVCPRQTVAMLRQKGILAVSGAKIDGGPVYWFNKEDSEALLKSAKRSNTLKQGELK